MKRKLKKYCCKFLEQQIEMRCEVHGDDCPDQVIKLWKSGNFGLEGRNASYLCEFCPACGFELKKLLK